MNQEQLWRELTALPPDARQQVFDFIAFLHWRYTQAVAEKYVPTTDIRNEPFIGLWHDREDMKNSSEWVRTLRVQE
jgi:hypothetical protein